MTHFFLGLKNDIMVVLFLKEQMMKLIKLHSLMSFYILVLAIMFLSIDSTVYDQIHTHYYSFGLVMVLEMVISLKLILQILKRNYIAYSELLYQFTILVVMVYALEYKGFYFYLILFMTVFLYYLLYKMHLKALVKTGTKQYYHLKIRNNFLLTVIYIGYGVFCYVTFIMTHNDYINILNQIENALYYVIYPYLIIILILFKLQYDVKTDKYNTINKYRQIHLKSILKRNILLNGLSLLLFLM